MVARPIHRFGAADRLFNGAEAATADHLRPGMAALFGVAGEASRAMRDASWTLPPATALADLGDVCEDTTAPAALILARNARPFLCAGPVPAGAALLAAARGQEVAGTGVVLISPRLDALAPAGASLAIGTHDLLPARDVARWTGAGGLIVTADAIEEEGAVTVTTALARLGLRRALVLFDLGVIDTGHAAGADAVNVGGLTPAGLAAVLSGLRAGCEVAVLAICGLAPRRDPRGHSERLAAQVVAALA